MYLISLSCNDFFLSTIFSISTIIQKKATRIFIAGALIDMATPVRTAASKQLNFDELSAAPKKRHNNERDMTASAAKSNWYFH